MKNCPIWKFKTTNLKIWQLINLKIDEFKNWKIKFAKCENWHFCKLTNVKLDKFENYKSDWNISLNCAVKFWAYMTFWKEVTQSTLFYGDSQAFLLKKKNVLHFRPRLAYKSNKNELVDKKQLLKR